MESCRDFIQWLGPDLATSVLMCLDDPADLVRLAAVSHSWEQFAIENGFLKKLCFRLCPEVSIFSYATEVSSSKKIAEVGSSNYEWGCQKKDHRIYSYFSYCLASSAAKSDCIYEPIGASSTDNPDEGIENTLEPRDRVHTRPSYWSSKGEKDPGVPEMLTYRLRSKLCVIDEIRVQPFQAFFQHGYPIYSAKTVQFRMGYSKLSQETRIDNMDNAANSQKSADDNYVWTYTSPQYPMDQENVLQSFKLPRPVICIGGILQIELLGRVQKQEMAGAYYFCVCHVQVIGHTLSPVFDVDTTGNPVLKYFPDARPCATSRSALVDEARESMWCSFVRRIMQLVLRRLCGPWFR